MHMTIAARAAASNVIDIHAVAQIIARWLNRQPRFHFLFHASTLLCFCASSSAAAAAAASRAVVLFGSFSCEATVHATIAAYVVIVFNGSVYFFVDSLFLLNGSCGISTMNFNLSIVSSEREIKSLIFQSV